MGSPSDFRLDDLVTSKGAAEMLGVTTRRVRQLAVSGELVSVDVRVPCSPWPARLFARKDIEAYAEARDAILRQKLYRPSVERRSMAARASASETAS